MKEIIFYLIALLMLLFSRVLSKEQHREREYREKERDRDREERFSRSCMYIAHQIKLICKLFE